MPYCFNDDTSKIDLDNYINEKINDKLDEYMRTHMRNYDFSTGVMKYALFSTVPWTAPFQMMGSTVGTYVFQEKDISLPGLKPLGIVGHYMTSDAGQNCNDVWVSDLRLDADNGKLTAEVSRNYGSDPQTGSLVINILYVFAQNSIW